MQISPLTMQDFLSSSSLEMELSREYVLEKVSSSNFKQLDLFFGSFLLLHGHRVQVPTLAAGNAGRADLY